MVVAASARERLGEVRGFIGGLYGPDLHAKRVDALAAATLGVMTGASLAVAMIGQALAQARGLVTKHAVKQVDRLMSNAGIDVWDSFARWVPQQLGDRRNILVAMDWTDFDHDSQSTLVLSLVTGHGRAAPLIWLTVWKEEIATRRNDYEDACLRRLAETTPPDCRVTILADRGFGDQKLFAFLQTLGFGYVIRFRGNIHVTDAEGQSKQAAEWVGKGGRARKLRDARVTAQGRQVGAVVCVHAKGMKEPWCLAASDPEATAAVLVNHYAKRWTIEPAFRDTKDLRFGIGAVGHPNRRADQTRPTASGQCIRHGIADTARIRRGESGYGPAAEIQYLQNAHPFPVPPGVHALRVDPQHARAPADTAHDNVRKRHLTSQHVQWIACTSGMRG